jgi:hypothetical protein
MKVGDQPIIFMVDSGAEHSVVTKPVASLSAGPQLSEPLAPKLPSSSANPRHANYEGTW